MGGTTGGSGISTDVPERRTILAPLPDESPTADVPRAVTQSPLSRRPRRSARRRSAPSSGTERSASHAARRSSAEKPDSSTKAYLWRSNVRFIDNLLIDMVDHGARPGSINRSVVLRAAITALEAAGMENLLAACLNEDELAEAIVARLGSVEV